MFRRILIKLSGEALADPESKAVIDTGFATDLAKEIKSVVDRGIQVAIVVGGGNIFRGSIGESLGMDRVRADYMGMLGTVINCLAIGGALENIGQPAKVFSAVAASHVVNEYSQPKALEALKKNKVVLLGGGTGNPYFTTDTASTLRAIELGCEVMLKGTKVDGVYSADPETNPDAIRFDHVTFDEALNKNLRVMDQTAFSMARDNKINILVFNMFKKGNIYKAATGEAIGTMVSVD